MFAVLDSHKCVADFGLSRVCLKDLSATLGLVKRLLLLYGCHAGIWAEEDPDQTDLKLFSAWLIDDSLDWKVLIFDAAGHSHDRGKTSKKEASAQDQQQARHL